MNQVITHADGSTTGYNDYGGPGYPCVLCHGAPDCRVMDEYSVELAKQNNVRLICFDRPGYGLSSPKPGHEISDVSIDAMAIIDALKIENFIVCGASTGGPYAFSLAVYAGPNRCTGVVVGCAMTDMRYPAARVSMEGIVTEAYDLSHDRDLVIKLLEAKEEKKIEDECGIWSFLMNIPILKDNSIWQLMVLIPFLRSHGWPWIDIRALFTHEQNEEKKKAITAFGQQGYADDRIAGSKGWHSFDIKKIKVPCIIVHGELDVAVPIVAAHHTKSLVPHAELRIFAERGHMSINDHIMEACSDILNYTYEQQVEKEKEYINKMKSKL